MSSCVLGLSAWFHDAAAALIVDGQLIAFRSDREPGGIYVMGATGENLRPVTDAGFNPSWSPDGTRIATASEDGHVRIWSVEAGATQKVLRGHRAPVTGLAWGPDGSWLASAGHDGTARIWSAEGPKIAVLGEDTDAPIEAMALSADGRHLATGDAIGEIVLYGVKRP